MAVSFIFRLLPRRDILNLAVAEPAVLVVPEHFGESATAERFIIKH
jgi:hypothetical protein